MLPEEVAPAPADRKSTRLNSSHLGISYAVFCLKKTKKKPTVHPPRLFFSRHADSPSCISTLPLRDARRRTAIGEFVNLYLNFSFFFFLKGRAPRNIPPFPPPHPFPP